MNILFRSEVYWAATSAARTLNFGTDSNKKVEKTKTEKPTPKIPSPDFDLFSSSQDEDPIQNISFDSSDDEIKAENKNVEIKQTENKNFEKDSSKSSLTGMEWLKKLENKELGKKKKQNEIIFKFNLKIKIKHLYCQARHHI